MKKYSLVVAALLLTSFASEATAAEEPGQHKSKSAQKVLATLNLLGMNDKDVQNLVSQADQNIDNGYFYLSETKTMGGKLCLRYDLSAVSTRQVELRFAFDDSPVEFTARTNIAQVRYHHDF
jgi:hypothetical protein